MITVPFYAEEEGNGENYTESDIQFTITLDADSNDRLQIEGKTIALKRLWENSGTQDREAVTEYSLSSGDGTDLVNVRVELLEIGCARASIHWPNTPITREIIGRCDDWKSS